MEERKTTSSRSSFDELKNLLDAHNAKYEMVTTDAETSPFQFTYILYSFPVARGFSEVRIYDNDSNISAVLNSNFLKYRGITNYEAIYSRELKCIECELQAGRYPSASYLVDRIARCLTRETAAEDKQTEGKRVVLYSNDQFKVSVGIMSIELAFLSGDRRAFRYTSDQERHSYRASIKIENIECKTETEARDVLVKIANSLFYQIDLLYSIPVTLSSRRASRDEMLRRARSRLEQNSNVTGLQLNYEYDKIPMSLYWFAQNNSNSPFFRYFALYQVLEYYLPIYAGENLKTRMRLLLKDPLFNINNDADVLRLADVIRSNNTNGFGDEKEQLLLTIKGITDSESIMQYISERQYLTEYYNGKNCAKVSDQKLRTADKDGILADLATRIYDIRCRIVHNKASESDKKILPLTTAEAYLANDIELLQFLARKAIVANSQPFSLA